MHVTVFISVTYCRWHTVLVPQLAPSLQLSQSADATEHVARIAMAGNMDVITLRNTKASIIQGKFKRLELETRNNRLPNEKIPGDRL